VHAYRGLAEEIGRWRPDSLGRFREAAELGDRHYRLGALPISTYTELQKQYLDALDALLGTEVDALVSRAEIERLTGDELGGAERTVSAQ
jgi:cobalt-zinc-cadmium efflux system outer membrane protein